MASDLDLKCERQDLVQTKAAHGPPTDQTQVAPVVEMGRLLLRRDQGRLQEQVVVLLQHPLRSMMVQRVFPEVQPTSEKPK
jgi:hypothetical protein